MSAYYPGETNRCPGCGRAHWIVGRATAECGFCGAALALADAARVAPVRAMLRRGEAA